MKTNRRIFSKKTIASTALPAMLVAALSGCATTQPVAYSGVASSAQMQANPDNDSGRVPYSYSTQTDWSRYRKLILEPVAIYRGADNQFGDTSEKDRDELAGYMQNEFAKTLRPRFDLVDEPATGTLRLKLTLTGAETTTPVAGTFTRFDLVGGPYNIVQSIRGKEGSFTGSVFYTVEIYDAPSNRLLDAYVTKQYPNAMNVGASFGALGAAKTGIDKGAEALASQFD